jgi:hypothetical protein
MLTLCCSNNISVQYIILCYFSARILSLHYANSIPLQCSMLCYFSVSITSHVESLLLHNALCWAITLQALQVVNTILYYTVLCHFSVSISNYADSLLL